VKLIGALLAILGSDFFQPPEFKRVTGAPLGRKPVRMKFSPYGVVGQCQDKPVRPLADDALALAGNPTGFDPRAAILLQSLSAEQIRVGAACLFDGMTQVEAAEKFHLSPATVCRYVKAVEAVRDRLEIPERAVPKPNTRHVRQLSAKTYASL
jgi:hypothetical protein